MQQANDFEAQPGLIGPAAAASQSWSEWLDRRSASLFIAPAVVLILLFAIFPTIASIFIALSRVKFSSDGFRFRFVWFQNFEKQFITNEQVHFLGRLEGLSTAGWVFTLIAA